MKNINCKLIALAMFAPWITYGSSRFVGCNIHFHHMQQFQIMSGAKGSKNFTDSQLIILSSDGRSIPIESPTPFLKLRSLANSDLEISTMVEKTGQGGARVITHISEANKVILTFDSQTLDVWETSTGRLLKSYSKDPDTGFTGFPRFRESSSGWLSGRHGNSIDLINVHNGKSFSVEDKFLKYLDENVEVYYNEKTHSLSIIPIEYSFQYLFPPASSKTLAIPFQVFLDTQNRPKSFRLYFSENSKIISTQGKFVEDTNYDNFSASIKLLFNKNINKEIKASSDTADAVSGIKEVIDIGHEERMRLASIKTDIEITGTSSNKKFLYTSGLKTQGKKDKYERDLQTIFIQKFNLTTGELEREIAFKPELAVGYSNAITFDDRFVVLYFHQREGFDILKNMSTTEKLKKQFAVFDLKSSQPNQPILELPLPNDDIQTVMNMKVTENGELIATTSLENVYRWKLFTVEVLN
jgi:hypothetical protein